jgi:hypothetical protein
MSITKATKPVKIDPDVYNDVLEHLWQHPGMPDSPIHKLTMRFQAAVTIDDDCIDGDGSEMCETHNYLPMEYYLDVNGKLLKRGSFDPEGTGFPVCPDSQKYDEKLARKYARS